ncbi:hypothetical protein D3C84_1066350 [compost metagenome]
MQAFLVAQTGVDDVHEVSPFGDRVVDTLARLRHSPPVTLITVKRLWERAGSR